MKRSEQTEKKILQAALSLFVRNGYHGTSIYDITQKVGLTKGALYAHFSSKGELLLRIIDEFRVLYIDEMIRTVTEFQGNALEKLNCAMNFSAKFALRNLDLCVFLTFLTTELKADVDFQPALKRVYRKYRKFINELLSLGIRQGVITKGFDPDLGALVFMALHDGILHQWVLNRSSLEGKVFFSTFKSILMRGLKI
jgi:AcrR family transcriptional regulator